MKQSQILAALESQPFFRADAAGPVTREDGLAYFLAQQLEQVMTRAFDVIHPELKMANGEITPIDTSIDTGAESFTYYQYDGTAFAKLIASYACKDLPTVALRGAKFNQTIEPMGNCYEFTIQDVRNARFARRPLEQSLANNARRGHDQLWQRIGLFGDSATGLRGLLNHPNITITDSPLGVGGFSAWDTKTPDEIIADVNTLINGPLDVTNGVESITHVWMPVAQWSLISTTPRSGVSDTTILEFLRRVHPGVTFEWLNELAADKSGGNLASDAIFGGNKNRDKAEFVIPQPFEQFPPMQDGMCFRVACHSRTGGISMRYPLAFHRMDGV